MFYSVIVEYLSLQLHPPFSLASFFSSMDKLHLMLTELCSCYSLCGDFVVFDHIVVPTEFLISQLETRLSEYVDWGYGFLYMST